MTGPPGAGKSTLLSALLRAWRERRSATVAMLAVDPSSRRSGGSLLGDRARIDFDPADRGVLIRSTAAGERLGGLARATRAAAQALAAAFDVVVIETVGVGQAETEVADVADTVAVVVQPGSGDVLQFLKSGIMEIPDVLVVTKADLGQIAIAHQARPDARRCARSARARRRCSPSPRCLRRSGVEELWRARRAPRGPRPRARGACGAPRERADRLRASSTASGDCAPSAGARAAEATAGRAGPGTGRAARCVLERRS